jgi:hypothetical protein
MDGLDEPSQRSKMPQFIRVQPFQTFDDGVVLLPGMKIQRSCTRSGSELQVIQSFASPEKIEFGEQTLATAISREPDPLVPRQVVESPLGSSCFFRSLRESLTTHGGWKDALILSG